MKFLGMFLWIKLVGVMDTFDLIKIKAVEELVLMVPGRSFSPNNQPSQYVRASYSTASADDMDKAMQRLANLLKKERDAK
jgi:kynurenine/2-aminoadipate aminotransferase